MRTSSEFILGYQFRPRIVLKAVSDAKLVTVAEAFYNYRTRQYDLPSRAYVHIIPLNLKHTCKDIAATFPYDWFDHVEAQEVEVYVSLNHTLIRATETTDVSYLVQLLPNSAS
jgi:hypothetical protein